MFEWENPTPAKVHARDAWSLRETDTHLDAVMIVEALTPGLVETARSLFKEYAEAIGIDLGFQNFEEELSALPGKYAPPDGGLFIAMSGTHAVGCVALRPLEPPAIAELKRLYVRPLGRGKGLGLLLTQAAIERARAAHYEILRLDTLASMQDALRLYRRLGFREIPAYRYNPIPDSVYMELDLNGVNGDAPTQAGTSSVDPEGR